MDDLINRQAATSIPVIPKEHRKAFNSYDDAFETGWNEALSCVNALPSAQKKGHWNFVGDNLFECTCCEKIYTTQQLNGLRVYDKDPYCPFFCPNCGADMRGELDG